MATDKKRLSKFQHLLKDVREGKHHFEFSEIVYDYVKSRHTESDCKNIRDIDMACTYGVDDLMVWTTDSPLDKDSEKTFIDNAYEHQIQEQRNEIVRYAETSTTDYDSIEALYADYARTHSVRISIDLHVTVYDALCEVKGLGIPADAVRRLIKALADVI